LTLLVAFLAACAGAEGQRAAAHNDTAEAVPPDTIEAALADTVEGFAPDAIEAALSDAGDAARPDLPDAPSTDDLGPDHPAVEVVDAAEVTAPPAPSRELFQQIVADADAVGLADFLDAYDMPLCDAGRCLFVSLVPDAEALEVRGQFTGWGAGPAMTQLEFSDALGRRPWAVEVVMSVTHVSEYKLVADAGTGAERWLVDPSNLYFRFGEFGPNSAISAPGFGRLTRLSDVGSTALGNARDLFVYLPAAYFTLPARRFGVLYLQDGFNVFTNPQATYGSWEVEATADLRMGQGLAEPLLLVGIDTSARFDEYTWCPVHVDFGDGNEFWTTPRLADYAAFLVGEVVPLIDGRFRTLAAREHRGIAGSSLGGVSSFWIAWHHPEAFSRAGVFSPSTWIGEPDLGDDSPCTPLRDLVAEGTGPAPSEVRFYLDAGDTDFEGTASYTADAWVGTDWTRNALVRAGWGDRPEWDVDQDPATPPVDLPPGTAPTAVPHLAFAASPPAPFAGWADYLGVGRDVLSLVGHGHAHNEAAWRQRFDPALLFLFPGPALAPQR
jgi:predicted alpha/beta superfamily hydrolase